MILAIYTNKKYMTCLNIRLIHRNNILYCNKNCTYILSLFKYISSSLLHPSSMIPRDIVVDHSSKELLLQTLTLLTASCTLSRWSKSSIVTMGSSTLSTCLTFTGPSSRPPLQCRLLSLLDSSFHSAELM